VRYGLAIFAAAAALILRKLLNPLLGTDNPYHTAWAAVVFSVWFCALRPAIATIVITFIGIWYWFLPPFGSFAIKSYPVLFGMMSFLFFSTVIVVLGETTRRIALKSERAEAELREAHKELEIRDSARTVVLDEKSAELTKQSTLLSVARNEILQLKDQAKERRSVLESKTSEVIEKAALLDMANDAILVKTSSGKISYWNQGAEKLYGWTMSDALGKFSADLLRSEYPIPLREIERRDDWEGEIRHTKRDGSQIVVASHWTTLRDQTGKPVGWLETNTDISYRKQAEDAARSLSASILISQDQERRRIARGLHDSLGQYLAALKMNLDLLSATDQKRLASECSEIVDKCLSETRTISHQNVFCCG